MRIHVFQHVPFEDEAFIGEWAGEMDIPVSRTRFFSGELPPEPDFYDWLVVMGGPMGVDDEDIYPWLKQEKTAISRAFNNGKRILGICLGAQLLADCTGGGVAKNPEREIGWFPVEITGESPLLAGVPERFNAFHWHGDRFFASDSGVVLGESEGCAAQILQVGKRALGFQFHLESTPERITALMANCPEDMIPGRYVQTGEMLEQAMGKCKKSNRIMRQVLENMLELV